MGYPHNMLNGLQHGESNHYFFNLYLIFLYNILNKYIYIIASKYCLLVQFQANANAEGEADFMFPIKAEVPV
uniref:Uncharacterized protein n=1 Tax=Heterorhabditis bacteriophora TaxID=37862 RepID=A0A1I7WFA5_HETBA